MIVIFYDIWVFWMMDKWVVLMDREREINLIFLLLESVIKYENYIVKIEK